MTEQQLEALRELIIAEVESGLESIVEDSEGYRGSNQQEQQHANHCFEKLLNMFKK